MEEKLQILYKECIEELKLIGIDVEKNKDIGEIDIKIAPRNSKRYGCCRQENPDKTTEVRTRKGRAIYVRYNRFFTHHIEISKWVMNLNDKIIKNTIMHEIIHCFPGCNDHGKYFKMYANLINDKLGYNISRLGNREVDYKESNLEFKEQEDFKYKIVCENCGQIIYRKRLMKNFVKKYRCGKCRGKLKVTDLTGEKVW